MIQTINLPKQAVCALIVHNGKILTTTRRHTDVLCLLGGKVDPGETPLFAMLRELEEETGIIIVPGAFTPIYGEVVCGQDKQDYYCTTFWCWSELWSGMAYEKAKLKPVWEVEPGIVCSFQSTENLLNGAFSAYNQRAITNMLKVRNRS